MHPSSRPTHYRGRLAPSPTGLLHLGHARTFAIAAQRARDAAGTLILRNEDLDPQRSQPRFAQAMLEDLRWLGIAWQEGPDVGGPFAPYRQSEARPFYLQAWRQLAHAGWLYPCHCSRRELRAAVSAPHDDADDEPLYPGTCRPAQPLRPGQVPDQPSSANWRFRVPHGEAISFVDGYRGPLAFTAGLHFGDFPVWRRDDVPAYQLAVVVDDSRQRISEVVRGADLLRSTARQLLLYRALELTPPAWFHCPLVTDEHGRRLAKRSAALLIRALREQGLSPGQVLTLPDV